MNTPGKQFRLALTDDAPLQIAGVPNAYCAMLAEQCGFLALYLSGAGVANACFGKADLGVTELEDVATETRRICGATSRPLLVDADTGWNDAAQTVRVLEAAGAAAIQIEDQVAAKRCGHRPGKQLVSTEEMCNRIQNAVSGKQDQDFVVMARTDAVAVEGIDAAIARAKAYIHAGADMIFAEALTSLDEFTQFCQSVPAPVLANLTEFGKTPQYNRAEMAATGVAMLLYPLSAFRMMNAAALLCYQTIRTEGSQASILPQMQTREQLYQTLSYLQQEAAIDQQNSGESDQ